MSYTSQDLLLIVLSLCILWFTVFLCWLLYQAGRVLRNANRIIENVTAKLELIVDAVHFIKERMEGLSSSMGMIGGMVGKMVEKRVSSALEKRSTTQKAKKKKATAFTEDL